MGDAGRDLWVQPLLRQGHQEPGVQTIPVQLLSISKDGDATTCGQPVAVLSEKN